MTEGARPIRMIIADDHPVVLGGLKGLIETDCFFEVLAAYSGGRAALDGIREHRPDLALLDVHMPEMTGVEVLEAMAAEGMSARVVLLTASANDAQIVRSAELGARGILMKDTAAETLLECLHTVAADGRWLPAELVRAARDRDAERRSAADQIEKALTLRERELALLVAEGLSNKQIARRLKLSEGTVKIHLHNIYQKFGLANRTSLAALLLPHRAGLIRAMASDKPD